MADSDKSLKLTIETVTNPAPVEALDKALVDMGADLNKLKEISPQTAEAIKKIETGVKTLEEATKKTEQEQKKLNEQVGTNTKKAGADGGRAVLELSRGLEDLQYGIGGVLNNLPGLIQMLGYGSGVAGVISILAVGIAQLVKHMGSFSGASEEMTKKAMEEAIAHGKAAEKIHDKATALEWAKAAGDAMRNQILDSQTALADEEDALKRSNVALRERVQIEREIEDAKVRAKLSDIDADQSLSLEEKARKKGEVKRAALENGQKRMVADVDQQIKEKLDAANSADKQEAVKRLAAGNAERAQAAALAAKTKDDSKDALLAAGQNELGKLKPGIKTALSTYSANEALGNKGYANPLGDVEKEGDDKKPLKSPKQQTSEMIAMLQMVIDADSKTMGAARNSWANRNARPDLESNIGTNQKLLEKLRGVMGNLQGADDIDRDAGKTVAATAKAAQSAGDPDDLRRAAAEEAKKANKAREDLKLLMAKRAGIPEREQYNTVTFENTQREELRKAEEADTKKKEAAERKVEADKKREEADRKRQLRSDGYSGGDVGTLAMDSYRLRGSVSIGGKGAIEQKAAMGHLNEATDALKDGATQSDLADFKKALTEFRKAFNMKEMTEFMMKMAADLRDTESKMKNSLRD